MVTCQFAARGITNPRVLSAMRRVPRHRFVDPALQRRAYEDAALPTAHGQTISQPYMVAVMTELLDVHPADRVLEVGTGSGYQAMILSLLAGAVVTIERNAELADAAAGRLASLGATNVEVVVGDGSSGGRGVFDKILVTAGAPSVPDALRAALGDPGRMVIPVGDRVGQVLQVIDRRGGHDRIVEQTPCRFVPLVGAGGWPEAPNET